jgi:hypothetical protein
MKNGEWRLGNGEGGDALAGAVLLARALAGVKPVAGECAACLERLPAYVDAEMTGQSGAAAWQGMRRHLLLCARCAEEYADLLETVWLATQGRLPPDSPMPTPDLSFLRRRANDQ